ncbi:hypothetical protein NMY22_g14197 [Coprinellus aureogranulatus]|nr:hypothetical protein NMY22_g14197 [Coprinellus aureogranulatus]
MASPSPKLKQTAVFLQNACVQHRYIRSQDLSNIVERPERLRAVNIGLAAAIAHLEDLLPDPTSGSDDANASSELGDLASALNKLNLDSSAEGASNKVKIVQSEAKVDILNNAAVKFIHGDIDGDIYLETLQKWVKESADKIAKGESEIPEGYSQGDLYLCPESLNAIQGALGTVCEAVDNVMSKSLERAFVAIRPPGHHCGEDTPSGFCFVNNVAVAAAHAHLKHSVNRIVIFDIDLHHGNGTQSIVWQINEETYRQKLEQEAGAPSAKPGAQVFYGSTHDILSYPCEDGKVDLVQAASTSIHNAHGQWIENVHLQPYTSEEHFWTELYDKKYKRVLTKAEQFLEETGGPGDDVLFFISCGMDACEHEYPSMSRHNRKVPTSYYYRFARDACALADKYAGGRLISVLEGGYSDRALISGAMAHFVGLTDTPEGGDAVDEGWWAIEHLIELEKATKKRRGGRPSLPAPGARRTWIERTLSILAPLDSTSASTVSSLKVPGPPPSMTLRDRSKISSKSPTPAPSPPRPTRTKGTGRGRPRKSGQVGVDLEVPPQVAVRSEESSSNEDELQANRGERGAVAEAKRLPRVVLKLGKGQSDESS